MRELIQKVLREELEEKRKESFNSLMNIFMKDYNIWQGTGWDGPTLYFVKKDIDFADGDDNWYRHDFTVNTRKKYLSVNYEILNKISNYLPIDHMEIMDYMKEWIKDNLNITDNIVSYSSKINKGFTRPLHKRDLINTTDWYGRIS